jgi:hypothetical protein
MNKPLTNEQAAEMLNVMADHLPDSVMIEALRMAEAALRAQSAGES